MVKCVYHPGLEDSIKSFRDTHRDTAHLWSRGSKKLLILIPLNANISDKLEHEDGHIHFVDNLAGNEIDRAGVRSRVYKHSVYGVQDEEGKVGEDVDQQWFPLDFSMMISDLYEVTGRYQNKHFTSQVQSTKEESILKK